MPCEVSSEKRRRVELGRSSFGMAPRGCSCPAAASGLGLQLSEALKGKAGLGMEEELSPLRHEWGDVSARSCVGRSRCGERRLGTSEAAAGAGAPSLLPSSRDSGAVEGTEDTAAGWAACAPKDGTTDCATAAAAPASTSPLLSICAGCCCSGGMGLTVAGVAEGAFAEGAADSATAGTEQRAADVSAPAGVSASSAADMSSSFSSSSMRVGAGATAAAGAAAAKADAAGASTCAASCTSTRSLLSASMGAGSIDTMTSCCSGGLSSADS